MHSENALDFFDLMCIAGRTQDAMQTHHQNELVYARSLLSLPQLVNICHSSKKRYCDLFEREQSPVDHLECYRRALRREQERVKVMVKAPEEISCSAYH